ncbi:MAG: hypothetical protein IT534_05410 [Bauldia sp.]|nr:hypothetical protein [Bauldia sp.]
MMELIVSIALLVGDTPVTLVKELMRQEIEYLAQTGRGDPLAGDALNRLFTDDLQDAYQAVVDLQAALGMPLIDGDPITGHQDYCPSLRGIVVDGDFETQTTADVTARFMSQWCHPEAGPAVAGEVAEIVFHLVKYNGEWRISDFDHSLYGSFRDWLGTLMATVQTPAPAAP